MIATVEENGEIIICEEYKQLINNKEFLLQLQNIMPMSLEKLQQIQARKNKDMNNNLQKGDIEEQSKTNALYKNNPKDIIIDMDKKITETKTFADLVPEVKQKHIVDVVVRRTSNVEFSFIGIDQNGEEVPLETLKQTEGTNPKEEIIEVNKDGSEVKKDQVLTMLRIQNGQNQGKGDEGFTVELGAYGIPEVNYYRRASQTDQYTSIPVNLENTNQKRTEKDVREYMEKKRNTQVQDNIERANDRIEQNEDKETTLENIDDDLTNDNIIDNSEIMIRKAAKRCKISVESFKEELEKTEGKSLEEKIEEAEESINEQFRGNTERRA